MTNDDLRKVLSKPGYGIESQIGKGAVNSQISGAGKDEDLERAIGDASLRSEAVSLNYTGKCVVRIKFFRYRLADYSRAIAEKAIIDTLVYGGVIRDDSEKEICLIDEGQVKVATREEERTEIILEYQEVDLDNIFIPRTKFGNSGTKE